VKHSCLWSKLSERDEGYLLDFFIGDGNIFIKESNGQYRVRMFCNKRETKIIAKVGDLLRQVCDNVREYVVENDGTIVLRVHSKALVGILRSKVDKDKTLKTLEFPEETGIGLIEGLIDSDGYIRRKYVEITSSRKKKLADQVREMLSLFLV